MAQWVTPCLPRFPDLDPHDVAHAETTTDDAILHSSIRSSGAQNVPPLTRDVEPVSASAASSTMHSRDRMQRPVWAPSPLTSSADEAVTGCVCSRENAVTTLSTTAPRARLTAMSRIIARGISRLQRCLSANATPLRIIGLCAEAPVLLDQYSTYNVGTWCFLGCNGSYALTSCFCEVDTPCVKWTA